MAALLCDLDRLQNPLRSLLKLISDGCCILLMGLTGMGRGVSALLPLPIRDKSGLSVGGLLVRCAGEQNSGC